MADTIDWPPPRPPKRRGRLFFFAVIAALVFGGGTALTYYVDALWFNSLGFADVFWKTLNLQAVIFTTFTVVTFAALYGSFLALKPERLGELAGGTILINGQPMKLPVEPVLKLIALGLSALIALVIWLASFFACVFFACSWIPRKAGNKKLIKITMMMMTTSNSKRVNP